MKKLLLILLLLPMIGFGQAKKQIIDQKRKIKLAERERRNQGYIPSKVEYKKIRTTHRDERGLIIKKYKISHLDTSDLRLLVDKTSYPQNNDKNFSKKRGFLYYKNILFTGIIYELYDDQAIYKEVNYKNGVKHSFSTSWHNNGQVKSRKYFVNNQIYFPNIEWYNNGQKKWEITALKNSVDEVLTYEINNDSVYIFSVKNYNNKLTKWNSPYRDIYFDSLKLYKYANQETKKNIQINNSKLEINNLIDNRKNNIERYNILIDSLEIYNQLFDIYMYDHEWENVQKIIEKYNKKGKLQKKKMLIYSGYLERKNRINETEYNIKQIAENIRNNDIKISSYLSKIEQYKNEIKEINNMCDKETKKSLLAFIKTSNFWYENGQLSKQMTECKKIEGLYQEWYKSGQTRYKRNYKNGQGNGLWEEWYENGQMKYARKYKNNKYHGFCQEWHENGKIKKEYHNKEGKIVNTYKEWYDNGQLASLNHYTKDGVKNGTFQEWFENGKNFSYSKYLNGKLHGFWKEWDENSKLEVKYEYANGKNINKKNNIDIYKDNDNNVQSEKKYPCSTAYGAQRLMQNYLKDLDGTQISYKGRRQIFDAMPGNMDLYYSAPPTRFTWYGFCYIGNDAPSLYIHTKNGCKSFTIEIME